MHVAILGLGAMGSRMAVNLITSGHAVTAWNRTPRNLTAVLRQGMTEATSPRDAVQGADVVIAMVRDDDASRRVWLDAHDGALDALPLGAIAIESSTLSVTWIKELAAAMSLRGTPFLDAPVLGSRAQADGRQLIHLVGGEASDLERVRPVFASIGAAVHHCGSNGTGAAMKLVANALLGVQVAALAELIGAAEKMGIDCAKAVSVLGQSPLLSPASRAAAESMATGSFAPAFPVSLLEKDLCYLIGEGLLGNTPLSVAAKDVFQKGIVRGFGDEHMTAIFRLYSR